VITISEYPDLTTTGWGYRIEEDGLTFELDVDIGDMTSFPYAAMVDVTSTAFPGWKARVQIPTPFNMIADDIFKYLLELAQKENPSEPSNSKDRD
jgi:hypothetical protein